jgi:hypothetical protein
VDNSAPIATLTTPAEVLPTQDVIVTVTDASSGVDQVAEEIDPTRAPDPNPFGYSYGQRAAGPVQFHRRGARRRLEARPPRSARVLLGQGRQQHQPESRVHGLGDRRPGLQSRWQGEDRHDLEAVR